MRNKHHDYCINSLLRFFFLSFFVYNFNKVEPKETEKKYACRQKDIYSQRMLNRNALLLISYFQLLSLPSCLKSLSRQEAQENENST